MCIRDRSVTYGIDGYTSTNFDEDAKRAFVNGMSSVLRVDPSWITVTGVMDDLSAAAVMAATRSAGLGADAVAVAGGVSVTFTVKAIDETQASTIGATLNTVSTVEGGGGNQQSAAQEALVVRAMHTSGLSNVQHVKRETTVTKANIAAQEIDASSTAAGNSNTTKKISDDDEIDPGTIAGSAIGILVVLAIVGYCFWRLNTATGEDDADTGIDSDENGYFHGDERFSKPGGYYSHRGGNEPRRWDADRREEGAETYRRPLIYDAGRESERSSDDDSASYTTTASYATARDGM